jgi:hypothetical protein
MAIPKAELMQRLRERRRAERLATAPARACEVCGSPLPATARADAKCCSAGCRAQLSRTTLAALALTRAKVVELPTEQIAAAKGGTKPDVKPAGSTKKPAAKKGKAPPAWRGRRTGKVASSPVLARPPELTRFSLWLRSGAVEVIRDVGEAHELLSLAERHGIRVDPDHCQAIADFMAALLRAMETDRAA